LMDVVEQTRASSYSYSSSVVPEDIIRDIFTLALPDGACK
jgi:hypothetical protein